MAGNIIRIILFCISILFAFTGCATRLPTNIQRIPSTAITDNTTTSLGALFGEAAAEHPGESGFALIPNGHPAFTDRVALTTLAEKSLDLQYYIWEGDTTGRILALRLVEAADRGVRVRVLVDDTNLAGRDSPIAALDAHPNIEIRIFNPFAHRGSRLFGYLTDFNRLNHRMHNKVIIADNGLAIVGGRNIGNHYFGVHTEANFRDLDIAAAGPIVRDLSNVFDQFWNGPWSYPISALVDRPRSDSDLRSAVAAMQELISDEDEAYPYPLDQEVAHLTGRMKQVSDSLIWAQGKVIWDDPALVQAGKGAAVINQTLHDKLQTLKKELLIESAYFVPTDRGVREAQMLRERGVRIRVLTNSLASNDVVAAHAGYAKYRKALIEAGVEMYELRADSVSPTVVEQKMTARGESKAALHTKAIVFDHESIFVGSFNLDPRSANINTEMGLYVKHPELARQLTAYMDEGVMPRNAYRVMLDDKGKIVWRTEKNGTPVTYTTEPESTFWERFVSGFVKMLPVEEQL
jgi:putative cardiolipin synthase